MNSGGDDARASALATRFVGARRQTERLCAPLSPEDLLVQSMPDASPAKWHLAHTTWFFEALALQTREPYRAGWERLFNSYYESLGPRHARAQRGLLTRPTAAEVRAYREAIDAHVLARLSGSDIDDAFLDRIELGIHHEEQHQELLLTDLQHAFSCNPLAPIYRDPPERASSIPSSMRLEAHAGGIFEIGHAGSGFSFDNERPRHRIYVAPFSIASRAVTAGEFAEFIADGGYERPLLWLSAGWDFVQAERIAAPLYWERDGDRWVRFSLYGKVPVDPYAPVCHVSYFEADAYARWRKARLPTEAEWEIAARESPKEGQFLEDDVLIPIALREPHGLLGGVWTWTQSAYAPYPGFVPPEGALGEYNAKFMIDQLVLRGGSCLSPRRHLRATYRNFFPARTRWQVSGIRLAQDA